MGSLIELEGIRYDYFGRIPALGGVSLSIEEGERFAVIGANGTGKSTLLHILDGLLFPSGGCFSFRGREVTEASLRDAGFLRFFRERVGYVFQDSDAQLFCPTVLDELLYGPLQLALSEDEATDRANQVMQMMGIDGLKDRPTYMLSAGEKKRVAIGSVLTMNPEVLLLDEPTNGLDPEDGGVPCRTHPVLERGREDHRHRVPRPVVGRSICACGWRYSRRAIRWKKSGRRRRSLATPTCCCEPISYTSTGTITAGKVIVTRTFIFSATGTREMTSGWEKMSSHHLTPALSWQEREQEGPLSLRERVRVRG